MWAAVAGSMGELLIQLASDRELLLGKLSQHGGFLWRLGNETESLFAALAGGRGAAEKA